MKDLYRLAFLTVFTGAMAGQAAAQSSTTDTGASQSQMPGQSGTSSYNGTAGSSALQSSSISQRQGFNRASKIIGAEVRNSQNRKIGVVNDVVLDTGRNQIAYAVVSFSGTSGAGNKYYPIPWSSLQKSASNYYLLNVDTTALRDAPSFDRNNWPDMSSDDWNRSVYRYYNQTPYWQSSMNQQGNFPGSAGY